MDGIGKMAGQRRDFTDPLTVLSDCHRRVERFLGVLDEAAHASGRELTAEENEVLQRVSRFFREAGVRHTQDEEESLFPRLRRLQSEEVAAVVDQCAALDADHRVADDLHAEVDRVLDRWRADNGLSPTDATALRAAVDQLVALYEPHIAYEDNVLFPLCARVFSATDLQEIGQEMAARRQR